MIKLAEKNAEEYGLGNRVNSILGDAGKAYLYQTFYF